MAGVVEAIDIVSGLGEKMSVSSLTARNVEDSRASRQSQDVDDPRDFLAITLELEDGLVFEKVVRVEVRFPPFGFFRQKNTGSR